MLDFRREDRDRVARGEITVSFRLWKYARVKSGRTYETGFGRVLIEEVEQMPAGLVEAVGVAGTGFDSVEEVLALAGQHNRVTVTPDTILTRVRFRFLS